MNPKTSQDLFNKIRSQFANIRLGDENGAATADPQGAVFFEFEFQEDADTFGSVSISLADGENMKVVKKKREFEIQMSPEEYLLPGDFPNRQLFREKISEALDIARQRVF